MGSDLGDYDCPECKQTSLRKDASRCPLCRSEISNAYWQAEYARETALGKAWAEIAARREEEAAAERIRTAPQREAAARAEQQQRRNKASRELAIEWAFRGPALGAVVIGFAGCWSCIANAPRLNTLFTPFNLLNGLLYGALIGLIVGPLLGFAVGQMKD